MGKYANYDPQEDVIFFSFQTANITGPILKEGMTEVIAVTNGLPHKVFMVSDWQDVTLSPDAQAEYGRLTAELMRHIRGIVRYGANKLISRTLIRSETIKHQWQGTQSHIYPTKEEALAVVRKLEKEQQQ
jgi:hypothetical protein